MRAKHEGWSLRRNILIALVGIVVGVCAGSLITATAQDTTASTQQALTVCSPVGYSVELLRAVDADTLDLDVDLGLEVHIRTRFRLYGIDAWEVRGEERPRGLIATEFAVAWLEASENLEVRPGGNRGFRRGKFGRWVVYLCRTGDVCLNDVLVHEGHAERREY